MLPSKHWHQVFKLWSELADFEVSHPEKALFHLMEKMCGWIRADNALWIGGVRVMRGAAAKQDAQHGWRGRIVLHWRTSPTIKIRSRQAVRQQDTGPAMTTAAITARAGVFRAHRLHDGFVDFTVFKRTPHFRIFFEGAGITDRMWIVCPVNADAESYFVFDRYHQKKKFSKREEQWAAQALRGLKWFHRHLMLQYGLPIAGQPLSAAERQVLSLLLTDKSEKEIATKLGKSFHTTHRQVTKIFRRLGVNGRAGLMALWLGAAGSPCAKSNCYPERGIVEPKGCYPPALLFVNSFGSPKRGKTSRGASCEP